MASPSGWMRKNSGSTPVCISNPSAAALATTWRSTLRGACATSAPSMVGVAAIQPTSGFHGSWMRLAGSGTASTSGSAGVMSNQVAKPANPAPPFAMASIAVAGTSLARRMPNRSV